MSLSAEISETLQGIEPPGSYKRRSQAETLPRQERGIVIYGDISYTHINKESVRVIPGGDEFTMVTRFLPDHPLLAGESEETQHEMLQNLIRLYTSQRSRHILVGITVASDDVEVIRDDDGWRVSTTFKNTGTGEVTVPTDTEMMSVFKVKGDPLTGIELVKAASGLSEDLSDVYFITNSGKISFEELLKHVKCDTAFLFEEDNPLYPKSIFLPYGPEMGMVMPGASLNLKEIPPRREGLLEKLTVWSDERVPISPDQVGLYKTKAVIAMPSGVVGLINRNGLPDESPHSHSKLLYDGHTNGHRYMWEIVGENSGIGIPTGIVTDLLSVI